MEFIDTHAHLDFEYDSEITVEQIVREARENNVTKIITIGSDPNSLKKIYDIANSYENVYYSLGVHPHEAKDFNSNVEKEIYDLNGPKCVAIGEIGLDYYYDHSPRDVQKKVFVRQLDMARELKLPIILHVRESDVESYDILKNEFKDYCNGVLHCYAGTKTQLKKYLDLGLCVSFTGIITFPKSTEVQDSAKYAPKEKIMIETDSPYLAPAPHRGKKNYPKYVVLVAQKLAELRGETLGQVAEYTTSNAVKLFF